MSVLVNLPFVVTRRPPPPEPPASEISPVAVALAETYGTDAAVCVPVDHLDAKNREKLRHNLVNVGHRARAKFGVSTRTGQDNDGRAVIFAWAREPRIRQNKNSKRKPEGGAVAA